MRDIQDTICAIATAAAGLRTIVRISGPNTLRILQCLVRPSTCPSQRGVFRVEMEIAPGVTQEVRLYLFLSPHSYTGQSVAEIHAEIGPAAAKALVSAVLAAGARPADPGEFTGRAYLNGKLDLTAAEAVNEVISSTNRLQCAASQRMLRGRLSTSLEDIRREILQALGLIEASLDFADQDLPPHSSNPAMEQLRRAQERLEALLSEAIETDSMVHHPSVGIAGLPNAGKSTLFNALVGGQRSLVCEQAKTTRDVLEAVLDLAHLRCVLFDCAGLLPLPEDVLDVLAQRAALQSLSTSDLVLFCVDLASPDWRQDLAVFRQVEARTVVGVAAKADLIPVSGLAGRLDLLTAAFGLPFLAVSSHQAAGLQTLRDLIEQRLLSGKAGPDASQFHTLLTARLRQSSARAADHLGQALSLMTQGRDEIAAMMARAACEAISEAERPVDEEVLDVIFSRFCIGK
jgi:tRNA modification GTPase